MLHDACEAVLERRAELIDGRLRSEFRHPQGPIQGWTWTICGSGPLDPCDTDHIMTPGRP
jgi:hypothetical protein